MRVFEMMHFLVNFEDSFSLISTTYSNQFSMDLDTLIDGFAITIIIRTLENELVFLWGFCREQGSISRMPQDLRHTLLCMQEMRLLLLNLPKMQGFI